jgi:hypothetical protein
LSDCGSLGRGTIVSALKNRPIHGEYDRALKSYNDSTKLAVWRRCEVNNRSV